VRTIETIAADIAAAWRNPNVYARNYLDYMMNPWGYDSPRDAALYFLSNAAGWRGPDAKRLKAELKAVLGK
jgi:predicted lipoprotein